MIIRKLAVLAILTVGYAYALFLLTWSLPAQAQSKYYAPPLSYSNAELTRRDFSGQMLRSAEFSNANMELSNFSNADLRGAIMSASVMVKANLHGADLAYAMADQVNFTNADLSDTVFSEAIQFIAFIYVHLLMSSQLFSNLIVGVALLFKLIIFHRLTFFILTPPLDFFEDIYSYQKRSGVIDAIAQNSSFLFGYLLVFFFHIIIALISLLLRYFLDSNITIIDVILISMTPAILIYFYEVSVCLTMCVVRKDYANIYSAGLFKNILLLASNTIIIIIGMLMGWFAVNFFITKE
ncbi:MULTISPECIES: pentapeptide repeat-containing protein [Kamptonema]|uniref:pentapeptide repeat-containing protein n=1 Tax=Kamptonema TaxID=1501433 RepID=UPI0001DAD089|nr:MULTISPECIES: pentapeptide repeat-containing protein [Kamptonema]CBN57034.1 membrane hypothetical protein [Kamptonema sp. PCC 6506]